MPTLWPSLGTSRTYTIIYRPLPSFSGPSVSNHTPSFLCLIFNLPFGSACGIQQGPVRCRGERKLRTLTSQALDSRLFLRHHHSSNRTYCNTRTRRQVVSGTCILGSCFSVSKLPKRSISDASVAATASHNPLWMAQALRARHMRSASSTTS